MRINYGSDLHKALTMLHYALVNGSQNKNGAMLHYAAGAYRDSRNIVSEWNEGRGPDTQ